MELFTQKFTIDTLIRPSYVYENSFYIKKNIIFKMKKKNPALTIIMYGLVALELRVSAM